MTEHAERAKKIIAQQRKCACDDHGSHVLALLSASGLVLVESKQLDQFQAERVAELGKAWGKGYVEGCRTAAMSPARPVEDWHGKVTTNK